MSEQLQKELTLLLAEFKLQNAQKINCPEIRREWLPKDEVMKFLDFGNTHLAFITRNYNLVTTTIGKKRFYKTSSLLNALQKNVES